VKLVGGASGDDALEIGQRLPERGDARRQRVAVGQEDLGPHVRIAGGDPRRVPESARRQLERGRLDAARPVDQGARHQVRQVADRRHGPVVRLGIERGHPRAQCFPELGGPLERGELRRLRRRHDDRRALEQIDPRDLVAALLRARQRMAAHEGERPPGVEPLGGAHDVALRRPHVRDHGPGRRRAPHLLDEPLDRQHRRCEQDEVRPAYALGEIGRDDIERAVLERRAQPTGVAPDADEPPGEPAGPRGLGHGAAQEADADDRQLANHAAGFPRTVRNAFTSLRFSSGVPTVMRSAVSRPKGVIGRTITPWCRSF
jgi:hypothetical protein